MSQIKSKARVKDLGEVFTAQREVTAMLDLLPEEVFSNPLKTFLEPSCGTGNFLVEILKRKIQHNPNSLSILKSLSAIYGVDIALENIQESKARMLAEVQSYLSNEEQKHAIELLDANIVHGDFLKGVTFVEHTWEKL